MEQADHMEQHEQGGCGPCRRRVLVGGAGVLVGVTLVAGCGGGSSGSSAGPSSAGSGGKAGGKARANGSSVPLAAVADIPVGGAVSAKDASGNPLIVSRPDRGTVVAFSAICTHMGCTVAPHGGELLCPCHGSTYDLATGANTGGPAPSPLPKVAVTVEGGQVVET